MIADADFRFALLDLYAAYAACLDEARFEQWPEFFTEDCLYTVQPRENFDQGLPLATMALRGRGGLRDRIYGIQKTLFHAPYYQRHLIGPPRLCGDTGIGQAVEANYLVVRTKRDSPSEVFNAGRYLDLIVSTSDGLKFTEKRCIFDSELVLNSMIYPI